MDKQWLIIKLKFSFLVSKFICFIFPYRKGNQVAVKIIKYIHPLLAEKKKQTQPKLIQFLQNSQAADKAWDTYERHAAVSHHHVSYFLQADQEWVSQCQVDFKGTDHIKKALKLNRGLLVMTYHQHYNMLLCILLGRLGYPITSIAMDPKESPLYEYFSQQSDKMHHNTALHFNSGDYAYVKPKGFIRPIIRAFENQHLVVTANDFPDPFSGNRRITLPFMGTVAEISCPTGSVELAIKKNTPIVIAYLRWKEQNNFELSIEPVSNTLSIQENFLSTQQVMQRYISILERIVNIEPGLWEGWKWLHLNENHST